MVSSLNGINFASLFSPAEILCQTSEVGRDKVFIDLLQMLAYNRGIGNVDTALHALVAREQESPTIVAPGIAMPHARLEGVDNLVVAVAAAHRREGFDACQYAIDQFKEKLPTHKKETYLDGSVWVGE